MRNKSLLIALGLVVVVATGACDSSSSNETDPDSSGSGGTLAMGLTLSKLPGSLDTGYIESTATEGERFITLQLYDGLTQWDLTQGESGPELVGDLAESWSVSKDGLTWTFNLRPGVTFHDGTPWNADAAIFNLKRYLDKEDPLYEPQIDALMGYWLVGVDTFKKVDDMTIEINTGRPYAFLGQDLVLVPFASPTALQEMGSDEFGKHPVGTGPFKFDSMSGNELVMAPNADYWAGAPKLDQLILRPIGDPVARTAAFQAGEVNWLERPIPDDVPTLTANGAELYTNVYSHVWPWMYDMTKPPLDDPRVRKALNMAIDREAIAEEILQGTASPAYQLAAASDPGYLPELDAEYQYDPEAAKELLAEAGYPDGFEMRLSYPTGAASEMILPQAMNEALAGQLAEIGVDVKLEPTEWTLLLDDYYRARIPGGANALNVIVNYIPASSWAYYFDSASAGNVNHLDSKKVDDLLQKAATTFDPDEQALVFQELNRELMEEAPYLVVVSDTMPRVLSDSVKGFVQPQAPWVDLRSVYVES